MPKVVGVIASVCLLAGAPVQAEMLIDVDVTTARASVGETTLDDLSINDTAMIYQSFCLKDDRLYIPGWTTPTDLAASTYPATGVMLKLAVLPGKKLRMNFIDAAQAQSMAKGNISAPPVMTAESYNKDVREAVNRLFGGGAFGTATCDEEQRQNPLRTLTVFEVDSINGYNKLSDVLEAAKKN